MSVLFLVALFMRISVKGKLIKMGSSLEATVKSSAFLISRSRKIDNLYLTDAVVFVFVSSDRRSSDVDDINRMKVEIKLEKKPNTELEKSILLEYTVQWLR